MIAYVFLAVFVAACGVGLIAWGVLLWNVVRVPFNLKPGVDPWAHGNPLNNLFNTDALTSTGLAARKRAGFSLLVFGVALAVGVIAGSMAHALRP